MKELYEQFERFVHPVAGTSVALTAVMIRADEAVFIPEPLHEEGGLRLTLEQGRQGEAEPETVKVAWVTIRYSRGIPQGYAGVTVSELSTTVGGDQLDLEPIQEAIRRAVTGEIDVEALTPEERQLLRQELLAFNSQYWVQASSELKKALP